MFQGREGMVHGRGAPVVAPVAQFAVAVVDLDDHRADQPVAVLAGHGGQRRLYVGRVAVAVVLDDGGLDEGVLVAPGDGAEGFLDVLA